MPAAAGPPLAEALRAEGAAGDVEELAAALAAEHPMWNFPAWRRDGDAALTCDGEYSPRNPMSPFFNQVPLALLQ
jgi:hypothetical protein